MTLKGRVLPVGGIKEKVMSAHRAGIRHVMLPEANRRDVKDVPEEVAREMTITFATDVRQNLAAAEFTLTAEQVKRLDDVSQKTPIYPYWHQRNFAERNPLATPVYK